MRANLTIDSRRLWDMLMDTAQVGGTPKGGIRRLSLTDEDRRIRDWFRAECEALGCSVHIDTAGNMVAIRPARTIPASPSPWAAISTPSRRAASSTASSACSGASRC